MEYNTEYYLIVSGKYKHHKNMQKQEEKILCDDEQSRINKLENLLLIYRANSSKDVLQMIQNSAELYKKLFVSDVLMQNQYSEDFINYLTRILIVIAAIKRDGQGFLSIIKSQPKTPEYFDDFFKNFLLEYQGIQFGNDNQIIFIQIAMIHNYLAEMLEKENFTEAKLETICKILSKCCDVVRTKVEQSLLKGNSMIKSEVEMTDYYQKIAKNMLDIGLSKRFAVKILCMGLAQDIAKLEEMKYLVHKMEISHRHKILNRIHNALIYLSTLMTNKIVIHKCLESAKTCAIGDVQFDTCSHDTFVKVEDECEDKILNMLEYFSKAIQQKFQFATSPHHQGGNLHENLIHLDKRVNEDDLQIMEDYPRVEKLKRKLIDEEEEGVKPENKIESELDTTKIVEDVTNFNQIVSQNFKNLFTNANHREIKCELDETSQNYEQQQFANGTSNGHANIRPEQIPFQFNYKLSNTNCDEKMEEDEIKDIFKISDYVNNGFTVYEVENLMFFFLTERKRLYSFEKFQQLNCNKDENFDETNRTQPGKNVLHYLIYRVIPQFSRLVRLSQNHTYLASSLLEFMYQNYRFNSDYTYSRIDVLHDREQQQQQELRENNDFIMDSQQQYISPTMKLQKTEKVKSKPKKEKQRRPGPLNRTLKTSELHVNHESFLASDDILSVLLYLENSLKSVVDGKCIMNLGQFQDIESKKVIDFMDRYKKKNLESSIPVCIKTQRNQITKITEEVNLKIPCHMIGNIEILFHIMDKIIYDENNEPKISTSKFPVLSGKLKIYNATQTIKDLQIPIKLDGRTSKLNCSFYVRTNHKMNEKITENQNNNVTSSPTTTSTLIPTQSQEEINSQQEINNVQESQKISLNMNIVPTEIDFEDAIPLDRTQFVKKEFFDSTIKQEIPFSASNSPKSQAQNEFETFVMKKEVKIEEIKKEQEMKSKTEKEDFIMIEDSDVESLTDSADDDDCQIIPMLPKKFKVVLVDVFKDGKYNRDELLKNYGAELSSLPQQPESKVEKIDELFDEFDVNTLNVTK